MGLLRGGGIWDDLSVVAAEESNEDMDEAELDKRTDKPGVGGNTHRVPNRKQGLTLEIKRA